MVHLGNALRCLYPPSFPLNFHKSSKYKNSWPELQRKEAADSLIGSAAFPSVVDYTAHAEPKNMTEDRISFLDRFYACENE